MSGIHTFSVWLISVVLCIAAACMAQECRVLLDTSFVEKTRDCSRQGIGQFRGKLPAPWDQNYVHFLKGNASTRIVNRGAEHFLQFKVKERGAQFWVPLQGVKAGGNYRLTAYVRNQLGSPVKLSLRMIPAPWTTYSTGYIQPGDQWSRQTIHFKVPAQIKEGTQTALMLYFDETGLFDIVNLKLEESDGTAETVRRPARTVLNYFRNTRFPLGLQSGWSRHRDYPYGTIGPDLSVKGPSGEAALKLESLPGKQLGICSEPFNVADPNARNTISFAYCGEGSYTAEIQTENRRLASVKLEPAQTWKRIELPFPAPEDSMAFTVRLFGSGTIFVDSFRAAPEDGKGYVTCGESEVALAVPPSETSDSRIQFADEKPLVNFYVSGEAANVTLKSQVTNLYGESKDLPALTISGSNRSGTLNYAVFPEKPFGQFRIEIQAFRGEKAISPVNEIVVTRVERPVFWGKDAPDSPFGIHVLSNESTLKAVKAAGINWARLHDAGLDYIGWYWLEPEKGEWHFRDEDIQAYRNNQIKIFGQLGTAPKWASYLSRVDTGRKYISYHDHYFRPVNMEDFKNYAATVAARYKGVIDDWFVWNEPWITAWWAVDYDKNRSGGTYLTSKTPEADFAAMSRVAFFAVKQANPAAKVSGFNTTAGTGGERWTKGIYDAGGFQFCDTVDFHFYTPALTGYPDDACSHAYRDAVGYILVKNGKIGKPVYMSEGQGASTGGASGDNTRYAGLYQNTLPWDNTENYTSLADRNIRYVLSMLSCGVSKIFLYSAHCYLDFSAAQNFLVLFCADGSPHPMLAAHSAMARRLENMKFIRITMLKEGLWVYLFSDGKRSVGVISGRHRANNTEVACSLKNATASDLYGNPQSFPILNKGTLFYVEAPVAPELLEKSLKAVRREK